MPPMGPTASSVWYSPKLETFMLASPEERRLPVPEAGSKSTASAFLASGDPSCCAPGRKAILILTMASWQSCMRYLTLRL
eukprot:CAMPEP_0198294996 /NCGR_PEP_ID=MMETSP1449-20131203/25268_1 /TAXON_ID=420275 /ORGANISM="Attheya septentrionalis, Strain CCMP2084" /LENGTH=79 /DNA_ID=CAMNT_0043995137 /DNA_START=21 /DNA_END=260 /DNA_ORIENTATION=+